MFGALISFDSLTGDLSLNGYLFAIMVLFVVCPLALSLALLGSALNWRERGAVAWFGLKGFASVLLGRGRHAALLVVSPPCRAF